MIDKDLFIKIIDFDLTQYLNIDEDTLNLENIDARYL